MSQQGQEERLQEALIRLDEGWNRLSRQIAADIREYPHAIPPSQVYLLRLLDRRGALSMSDIASALGITLSGCTAVVDRAVEAGLVERQRDPGDRRVVMVAVSPEGEQTLAQVRQTRARMFARYLTRLEPGEVETLANLLERVADAVNAEPAAQVMIHPN